MKIVVCGNYGAKNIGDEMILKGLLAYLKDKYQSCDITVMSANPAETAKFHNVNTVPQLPAGLRSIAKSTLQKSSSTIHAIKECDRFILGGGGLFASQSKRANLIWYLQARPAIKYHRPLEILGQSLGTPRGAVEKTIIRKIFNYATHISVRDQASKKSLEQLGIRKTVEVSPDLAFYSRANSQHQDSSNTIAISLRYTKNWPSHLKQDLIQICNQLIADGHTINFVNFQQGSDSDDKIHREIAQKLDSKDKFTTTNPNSPQEAEQEIANSKLLIGMRLHSLITALKTGTPFLAISYGEKIQNFLTDLNKNQSLITLQSATFENLQGKIKNLVHQQ